MREQEFSMKVGQGLLEGLNEFSSLGIEVSILDVEPKLRMGERRGGGVSASRLSRLVLIE